MDILVVDDNIEIRVALSRFLEQNGFKVHSTQDALQALDVLDRERIDLVITDFNMPHMDGIRFTEALRQNPKLQAITVIMMTAEATDEVVDSGLRKGVAMTLAKPIDFDRLLTLVRFAQ